MKKIIANNLNDQWFFDNGYFTNAYEIDSIFRDGYNIVLSTEKWRKLSDTAFISSVKKIKENGKRMIEYKITTPEMLINAMNIKQTRLWHRYKTYSYYI